MDFESFTVTSIATIIIVSSASAADITLEFVSIDSSFGLVSTYPSHACDISEVKRSTMPRITFISISVKSLSVS